MKYLAMLVGGLAIGFLAGYAIGSVHCIVTQPPLDPMIEREIETCLTNNEVLLGMVDTLTADLNRSTETLTKTTASLDECVALAQVLLTQVGVTEDDLTHVCPMWAKFTTQECPP